MTQADILVDYINNRLSTSGLVLSKFGIDEVHKRFKLPADKGGYSDYWKQLKQFKKEYYEKN